MYKFLFIMDPLENIIPTKDTTYILMLEAESRGNEIFFALQDDLFIKNKINPSEIGRIYMGTESALDSSKPSATYATDLVEQYLEKDFGKRCLKNCDITDMTFACIGGVDALQNSVDWISSNRGKKAIVVCSDLSKYSLNSTGEYTQGLLSLIHI